MNRFFMAAVAASIAFAASADAAVILQPVIFPSSTAGVGATSTRSGRGTFHLYAIDTSDYGIATYSIAFGAAVTGINNRMPSTTISDVNGDPQSAGFTLLRSATNSNPMTGGQNLPGQTPFLIKGIGVGTSDFATVAAATPGSSVAGPTISAGWGGVYTGLEGTLWSSNVTPFGKKAVFVGEGAYNTSLFPDPTSPGLSALISSASFTTYSSSAANDFTQTATTTSIAGPCLGCSPPFVNDAVINNVDANNPGTVMHTFINTSGNLVGWSGFQFDSFVPGPGSSGTGPVTPATFDPATQKFNWNSVGSPIGTYKWLVTASNVWGTDQGSLTVNVTVPEPALATLLGSGLLLGVLRRLRTVQL